MRVSLQRSLVVAALASFAVAGLGQEPAVAAVAVGPVTAAEIIAACEAPPAELLAFCGLALAPPTRDEWSKVAMPTPAAVRGALGDPLRRGTARPKAARASVATLRGLDQSTVLWGATDFLLSRAEIELRQWAVDRYLRSLCEDDPKAPLPVAKFFPRACEVLAGVRVVGFVPELVTFREAMRKDLEHLPVAIARASGSDTDAAMVALEVAISLEHALAGEPPVACLAAVPAELGTQLRCATNPAAARIYQGAALLASLERTSDGAGVQVPSDGDWRVEFMALAVNTSNDGLFAAQWPSCQGAGPTALGPRFDVETLAAAADALQAVIRSAQSEFAELQGLHGADRLPAYGRWLANTARAARALVLTLPRPAPGVADALGQMERAAQALGATNYPVLAVELLSLTTTIGSKVQLPAKVRRSLFFAVDLSQAGTAKEASAAIERAAAPPGGYARKRASDFYFSVNAYVGGGGGLEWGLQGNRLRLGRRAGVASFWAPVGVEVGFGLDGHALGLFMQAIDLGALASWRINTSSNDELATRPEVGVAQVFSPGLAVAWGIKGAPFTFAATASLSPKLRTLESNSAEKRNTFRAGLCLAVDIPIFQ